MGTKDFLKIIHSSLILHSSVISVALVETNSRPMGVTLVNTRMSHKLGDPGDIVELAKTVQKGIYVATQ